MRVFDARQVEAAIADEHTDSREKFGFLWEYYYPRLTVYVKAFRGPPDFEAGDIVQDILLKVFGNLRKYNRIYSLSTWVYNIAKNHLIDLYRKSRKNAAAVSIEAIEDIGGEDLAGLAGPGDRAGVEDKAAEKDTVEKCRRCIKSLNGKDQRIVFLKYYEGLNSREIALIEGMSQSAVRRRLSLIRLRLKKQLGDGYEY
jgi:RNA polymerase sigma-70 factor (ECF subfamily)